MPDPRTTTVGPARSGPGPAIRIVSALQAADLAAWLLSPHRRTPAVVATVPSGAAEPFINVEELAEQRADTIDVYLVAPDATWFLTELLPDGCAVHSGAVRVYPASPVWHNSPDAAPLLRARNRAEIDTLGSRLRAAIRTALRSANAEAAAVAPRPSNVVPLVELPADGTVRRIETTDEAVAVARHLLDARRRWPVVLITAHPDAAGPYLPSQDIARDLSGVAAVAELTAEATFGLTEGLVRRQLSVFYGAGRVYPVGKGWVENMYQAPLRMCPDPARAKAVASLIVEDALAAAHTAGVLQPPAVHEGTREVTATVQGQLGERHVLLSVEGHQQTVLLAARLRLGVPVERLLATGQQLRGRLRGPGALGEFDPILPQDDPAARVRSAYPDGAVALARVAEVGQTSASLRLHPDVAAGLSADEGDVDLRDLLAVDDVVAVTVHWTGDEPRAALADDEGADPEPGVSVLPEGPAWLWPQDLEPDRAEPAAADEAEQPEAAPRVAAVPRPPRAAEQAAALAMENDQLRKQLQSARDAAEQYAEDLVRAQRTQERLERSHADMRVRLRKAVLAARSKRSGAQRPVLFADPVRQLRHEIWIAYLERFPETEREDRGMPDDYRFGPQFADSLAALRGITREKVVDVLVEVLVGLDKELPSRELHPWTVGKAGAQEGRSDGAKAWRVSLQSNTPGARRLKYWRLPGGLVEFDSVGHHDDGIA